MYSYNTNVKIRFGIGVGDITTHINKEMPLGADGLGYYQARAAIEYLKQNEKRKQTNPADIRIEVDGDNQPTTLIASSLYSQRPPEVNNIVKNNKDWSRPRERRKENSLRRHEVFCYASTYKSEVQSKVQENK